MIVWGRTPQEVLLERGIGADFRFVSDTEDTDLDFIHRCTAEADIYFVRNKKMRGESVDAIFRVSGKSPELWLPASGRILQQSEYRQTPEGVRVSLRLPPYGSLFVVFRKLDKSHDRTTQVVIDRDSSAMELTGPWTVRFPEGWGAPKTVTSVTLKSWTAHAHPCIRHFSGIARYETEFDIPEAWLGDGKRLLLDLGRLWAVGEVWLNGKPLGIVWKPPYRLEISRAAQPGRNRLEVEIANTWSNRLVGDALLPQAARYCRTNITGSGTPKKLWRDVPLHESGLLGPVRLIPAVEKTIRFTEK